MEYNKITCKIISCNKCDSSHFRNNIVNGSGNINSNIFFIGEAPGFQEDKYGIPFIGNSGDLLMKTLALFDIYRKDIYITNVVKCRPYSMYNNRAPNAIEINNCKNYLINEIKVGNPKIIVLLGGVALKTYFGVNNLSISKVLGRVIKYNDRYIIATYHPSYVLRNSDNNWIINKHINSFRKVAILYKEFINPLIQFKI